MKQLRDKIALVIDANYHTAISKALSTADKIVELVHPQAVSDEMVEAGWDALLGGPQVLTRKDMARIYAAMNDASKVSPLIVGPK